MRVLVVTPMYPTKDKPANGVFIKEQVDSLRENGVEVDVLLCSFKGKGKLDGYLMALKLFWLRLENRTYDLIHVHWGGSTAALARCQLHLPLVITFHGSDLLGRVGSQNKYILRGVGVTLVSKVIGVVATRCIVVADILRSKLWLKSAITIPMGVDMDLFKPMPLLDSKRQLKVSDARQRVLFVADPLNSVKRFDIAQAAVTLLQESGLSVEIVPLYDRARHEVPLFMNACDVVVMTSMHEASPCVIKEAMACNLPIVSVNVGDVAERIAGVDGCYLCNHTPQDVAKKLHRVLKERRRTQAREKIRDLSLNNVANKVIAVYQDVVKL